MIDDFVLELRAARRKSGLTQKDCAHLIGLSEDQYCNLERGIHQPSLIEIISLSILFGKSFTALFGSLVDDVRADMSAKLDGLPSTKSTWKYREERKSTLIRLRDYLDSLTPMHHAV